MAVAAASFFGLFKGNKTEDDETDQSNGDEDTPPISPEEAHIKSGIREALEAIHFKKYEQAEKTFHDILNQLQKYRDADTWTDQQVLRATIYVYSLMANMAMTLGQYARADMLFVEVMRGLVQDGKPMNDTAIVNISLKVASLKAKMGKPEDAEIGYEFCVNTQKEKIETLMKQAKQLPEIEKEEEYQEFLKEERGLLARSLHGYAQFLMSISRYHDAESRMRDTLATADTCLPQGHYMYSVLNGDLGNALAAQGKYEDSIVYYKKAADVTMVIETDAEVHIYWLCSLATAHAHIKDFKEAEKYCVKASKEARKYKANENLMKAVQSSADQVKSLKAESEKSKK